MADAADIKAGLNYLAGNNPKYKNKKTQLGTAPFDTLVADLSTWLEMKGKSTIDSADDKKLVARVIAHDTSFVNSFIASGNGNIGPYARAALLPLVTTAPTGPAYKNLSESFSYKQWPDVRADVSRVLGLKDKGHSSHGSNFKGDQTLRQVINNLLDTVQGEAEIGRIQGLLRQHYPGYL